MDLISNRLFSKVRSATGKNKNLFIFLVSILISGFLWILIAFDKNYNTTIPLHIIFRDYADSRMLKTNLPSDPFIIANLRGWDIIKYKRINKKITLEIDLREYADNDFIVLSLLKKSSPLNELRVLKFYPDTIYFELEKGKNRL